MWLIGTGKFTDIVTPYIKAWQGRIKEVERVVANETGTKVNDTWPEKVHRYEFGSESVILIEHYNNTEDDGFVGFDGINEEAPCYIYHPWRKASNASNDVVRALKRLFGELKGAEEQHYSATVKYSKKKDTKKK